MRFLQSVLALVLILGATTSAMAAVPPSELSRAEGHLAARFASRGLDYPPQGVALIALKREARVELWARAADRWSFVRSYLIRVTSGDLGPKLSEGDHQVPEGTYGIAALNAMSQYHLALRLDYPNEFDRARAIEDRRVRLGGDIMMHGGAMSDGCLPLGDDAIEEVFAVTRRVGPENVRVIVSPLDLRSVDPERAVAMVARRPPWLGELYASLATALQPFELPVEDQPLPVPPARRAAATCQAWNASDCVGRCETGDVASCARAGVMYAGGRGVVADSARAWSLLGRACAGGDLLGCAELASLYVSDDGPRRNTARAAELAATACDGGNGHGCTILAKLCSDRVLYPDSARREDCSTAGVMALRKAAVERLRGDCVGWNAYDCATLATIYDPGDRVTARRFAAGACEGGDPDGCEMLARLHDDPGASQAIAAAH